MMRLPEFDVMPLSPEFGAEVAGSDMRRAASQKQTAELRRLMDRYHLLLFRGQELDPEDQVRIVSIFGPVAPAVRGGPLHTIVSAPEGDVLRFHSDFSFTRSPLPFVSLYGVEINHNVATTALVSSIVQLPVDLHQRIAGRTVLRASDILCAGQRSAGPLRHDIAGPVLGAFRGVYHPALLRHPRTGEDVLFVNEYFSVAVEGLPHDDSEALLGALFARLYAPLRVYHHHWQPGDLLIFDNLALQHSRSDGRPRPLRRVVISRQSLGDLLS